MTETIIAIISALAGGGFGAFVLDMYKRWVAKKRGDTKEGRKVQEFLNEQMLERLQEMKERLEATEARSDQFRIKYEEAHVELVLERAKNARPKEGDGICR